MVGIPSSTFFYSAAWARVLHATYGYDLVYFVTRTDGRIRSLLPVMEVNSWLTGRRGVSLPFTDECEPLGESSTTVENLFQNAQAHGHARRWKSLECRGRPDSFANKPASKSYYSHHLKLTGDLTALFNQLESSTRRAIRKAEQGKLTLEFTQDLPAIQAFYELLCRTRQRHGVPPQPLEFFVNIQKHILAQNHGWVVLARHENRPVAGAVFFHHGTDVIYKFGASDETFQHLRANNLVMWAAIRHYASNGFLSFNFGRTAMHNEGLRRFKLSWGAEERQISYLRYDLRQKRLVTDEQEQDGLLNQLCRMTPRFLSRLAGSFLYKHIAIFILTLAGERLFRSFALLKGSAPLSEIPLF